MKKIIFLLLVTNISTAQIMSEKILEIDTSKSTIKWIGEYTFYFGGHDGTINFEQGHFIKNGDVITGGDFIIDMTSIKCNDIEDLEANEGLVNHLKDPDFFDVSNHKKARLSITKVEYHDQNKMRIEADMTIKGKTLPINFQAEVDYKKEEMTTRFKIDRRRWNIVYESSLQDGGISDAIGFEVTISL